ncbi:hypothetical protein AB6E88_11780 [Providencia hangzhouensis]
MLLFHLFAMKTKTSARIALALNGSVLAISLLLYAAAGIASIVAVLLVIWFIGHFFDILVFVSFFKENVLILLRKTAKYVATTAIRDGELVLSFQVEAGIFARDPLGRSIPSIYWYYLVDHLKGEIAPLRYRNGDPDDKLYGCIDEEGTE